MLLARLTPLLLLVPSLIFADESDPMHHAMELPDIVDASTLSGWERDGDWLVSSARPGQGDRVGLMGTVADPETSWTAEARLWSHGEPGPWTTATLRIASPQVDAPDGWPDAELRVLAADFAATGDMAQVRLWSPATLGTMPPGLLSLGWRQLNPVDEPGGNSPGAPAPPTSSESSAPRAVSQVLLDIGVVPRETWGASATNCTSPENNWYRFAIHHTAGSQTNGGTVQGAVQGLQNWAMGGGGYCDIPYQFLVGYDGSLWEGRNLNYYSGATGGGNNDGNIAISHLGCYHPTPACGTSHTAELIMRAAGRLLAQTLAVEHGITTNSDTLRGHRDYPGNSTACPGDFIHGALDEYRSVNAHFEGTVTDVSWEGDVVVDLDATESLWVEVRNDGLETWTANTKLAVLPRDQASPLQAPSWLSGTRVSSPAQDTPPGATATFALDVTGAQLGTFSMSFALVEEWVTWLADPPIGGGPAEGDITLTVVVQSPGDDDDSTPAGDDDDSTPAGDDDDSAGDDDDATEPVLGEATLVRGERQSWLAPESGKGCSCGAKGGNSLAGSATSPGWAFLLLLLPLLRRRR